MPLQQSILIRFKEYHAAFDASGQFANEVVVFAGIPSFHNVRRVWRLNSESCDPRHFRECAQDRSLIIGVALRTARLAR